MSQKTLSLADELLAAGEWPEPELFERILARSEEAVDGLIDLLGHDLHGWPQEAPVYHAIKLLGELQAQAAAPILLDLFYRYNNETCDAIAATLGRLGSEVVAPALSIARDTSLRWYPRICAIDAAVQAAGNDGELRGAVAVTVRGLLADCVRRAEALDTNGFELATMLVVEAAHLADPEARELIHQAFAADIVDTFFMNEEDVDRCYRDGPPTKKTECNWLEAYRGRYEGHLRRKQQLVEKQIKRV